LTVDVDHGGGVAVMACSARAVRGISNLAEDETFISAIGGSVTSPLPDPAPHARVG
jgi:hypothetical protein